VQSLLFGAGIAAMIGWLFWRSVGSWIWAAVTNPPSATLRIKRSFEGDGRRVVSVKKTGALPPGRSSPPYRCYRVEVLRHDGVKAVFPAHVSAGLFSDDLVDVEADRRRRFNQGSKTWFKEVESL
jgi:hypothetical protein